MQARFLLGPAGSGKTFRCLAEIGAELRASPEGLPLVLLAPKQATFQLERQLLAEPDLPGYSRLQILSFERLAEFVLAECSSLSATPETARSSSPVPSRRASIGAQSLFPFWESAAATPSGAQRELSESDFRIRDPLQIATGHQRILDEEGRVMVLRALLAQKQQELKIYRATARLPGFAQQLSLLLRELQRHLHSPEKLFALATRIQSPPQLADKLHDLALLLRAYHDWLKQHQLQDANRLLDLATEALRMQPARQGGSMVGALHTPESALRFGGLWLDGFAEMTPQELDFLAELIPLCGRATLAFCLENEPKEDLSWLSTWSVVSQTFRQCHQRLAVLPECKIKIDVLKRDKGQSRFARNAILAHLEAHWTTPQPFDGEHPSPSPLTGSLRVATCPNRETEVALAAGEILRHVRAGGRFRDCAVLLRTLEGYHDALRRVFARYEIPFFLDRREPVAHHPLAELTRYAVRLGAFGWEHDEWFGALKTGLVSSDADAIDRLENEARARGWEGDVWFQPLRITEDAALGRSINRWLENILPPFLQWRETLRDHGRILTGGQLAEALRTLWRALNVDQTLAAWSAEADLPTQLPRSFHATVSDQMNTWLDNVALAFAEEPLALGEWLPILEAGLAGLTVGVVPPTLDQVIVGAIDRSRNPDSQLAVLLGWNEGVFPAKPAPSRLLSDVERRALVPHDFRLGPDQRQQLGHERYYAYIACSRARERLVITCAARDAFDAPLNPSLFFGHLKRLFPRLEAEAVPASQDWRQAEHSSDLVAPLLASVAAGEPGASRELMPTALQGFQSLAALAAPLQKLRQLAAAGAAPNLPPHLVELLYGRELRTSASALEDFAACPFKFFAARGMRAEEREEFEADPRACGAFQHEILEQFHRELERAGKRWRDLSPREARERIGRIGEELLPTFRGGLFQANASRRFAARVLIDGAQRLIETLIGWMPQYRFDPSFAEVTFGLGEPGLPPWRLDLERGNALVLRGRIDRIDLCRPNGSDEVLAVVIDYKSRKRSLDGVKLQHGLELQLLSYLGLLRQLKGAERTLNLTRLLPAGVFYVSLKPKRASGKSRIGAMANAGQAIRNGYQHSGRFNADWLAQFDNRGEAKGDQFRFAINKDGGLARRGNDALEPDAFERLLGEVELHLRRIGNSIYDGDAAVAPFRKGAETACGFCEFRPFCRFDPWIQNYRVLRPIQ